ncbi:MAG: thiamine pyrophosphate-binding protein [Paracoccaceae bacterium]
MTQSPTLTPRTGGQVLVDQLLIHGADCAYGVPGESYLEVLDALHDVPDQFTFYNARHEAGAADMAETYGKLTGKPGICMVTRGPGACHAAIGVHIAMQDSTPMILLVGQIARNTTDREAFQEVDYRAMFGTVAKWATQIDDASRIPEYMARAFRMATSGRPGPVVIALPEDMLTDVVTVPDAAPYTSTQATLSAKGAEALTAAIARAKKPLMLVGGSGWDDASAHAITSFAEENGIPACCSFRRQDVISNSSPAYVGELGTATPAAFRKRVAEADLLIVIGARLGEMTTNGYDTVQPPNPQQNLIHIYPDPDEVGRVYSPVLGLAASVDSVAHRLRGVDLGRKSDWADWAQLLRREYQADTETPNGGEWALDMGVALCQLRDQLPDDVIVTLDAGNHTGWAQRFLRFGRPGRELGSTCGAMGYSVPAAVAASLAHPGRMVLSMVGDGGFAMSGMELATAAQYGATPIVLLFNNTIYGTIRMHQEREHPERVSGTALVNPDYTAMARAMGCHAERVERTGDFAAAFNRARDSGKPALLELITDPDQISSRTTITAMRAAHK